MYLAFFCYLYIKGDKFVSFKSEKDQTLMIGDNVEVTVLEIKGGQVRLGINAPKAISVHRGEIHEKTIQE